MEHITKNEMSVDNLNDQIEERNTQIKQLNADVFMLSESLKRLGGRDDGRSVSQ